LCPDSQTFQPSKDGFGLLTADEVVHDRHRDAATGEEDVHE
jgi:hypothetical protein